MIMVNQKERTGGRAADAPVVVLVAGPNIPPHVVRQHCVSALAAGCELELIQLRDDTPLERRALRALGLWYGRNRLRVVATHADWLATPLDRTLVVLSDKGLWRGDERVADREAMLSMPRTALSRLYRNPALVEWRNSDG